MIQHLDPSNGNPKYSVKYPIAGGVNKEHICASCMFDAVNWDFVKDKYYGCNSYHVTCIRNCTPTCTWLDIFTTMHTAYKWATLGPVLFLKHHVTSVLLQYAFL